MPKSFKSLSITESAPFVRVSFPADSKILSAISAVLPAWSSPFNTSPRLLASIPEIIFPINGLPPLFAASMSLSLSLFAKFILPLIVVAQLAKVVQAVVVESRLVRRFDKSVAVIVPGV